MELNIMGVVKDMGGAGETHEIFEQADAHSHKLVIVAEGLAAKRLKAAGLDLWFQGTESFKPFPFSVDAKAAITGKKIQVVVAGMGSPINLEEQFGLAVNELQLSGNPVKLVNVSDFWGSATRSKAKPDKVFVLDEADAAITRRHVGPDVPIIPIGNHGAVEAADIPAASDVVDQMKHLQDRFDTVILFAGGGGDYTTAELRFLKECLAKTPGSWVLIARFHPKWVSEKKPDGETYGEEWWRIARELGDQVVEVETASKGAQFKENVGNAVAVRATATLAGFSTLMTPAIYNGGKAISINIPETRASIKRQATIEHHPLVEPGFVFELGVPTDLTPLLRAKPDLDAVRRYLHPVDAVLAVDEIEKLCAAR